MSDKLISPVDIVSEGDIAFRLGVTRNVVRSWRDRDTRYPQPLVMVGIGRIALYDWREVIAYATRVHSDQITVVSY